MTDPLNLEPPDGDYVRYIESLQKRGTGSLKPLEPEDFMGGTEVPEKSAPSLKSLLKTLHIPGTSGEDESRRKALARMEEASRGATCGASGKKGKGRPRAQVCVHRLCDVRPHRDRRRRGFWRRGAHHLRRLRHSHFSVPPAQRPLRNDIAHDRHEKAPRRPALRRPSLITFAYFLRRIRKRSAFSRAAHWTARAKACQSSLHHSRIEAQRG